MMKRVLTVLALTLCLASTAMAQSKLLCVDMEQVFRGYYKTVREDARLKNQEKTYETYAKELAAELEKIKKNRAELLDQSLNIALSEDARAEKRKGAEEQERLYKEKAKELKAFMTKTKKQLGGRYLDVRRQLVQEINGFIKEYAKREKADYVIDRSGMSSNMIPLVIYYPENADITEAVLAELNRGHEDEVQDLGKKEDK